MKEPEEGHFAGLFCPIKQYADSQLELAGLRQLTFIQKRVMVRLEEVPKMFINVRYYPIALLSRQVEIFCLQ